MEEAPYVPLPILKVRSTAQNLKAESNVGLGVSSLLLGIQVGERTMRKLGFLLLSWAEEGGGAGEITHKVHLQTHGICLSHIHTGFLIQRLPESLSQSLTTNTHIPHTRAQGHTHAHPTPTVSLTHVFILIQPFSHV